MSFSSNVKQELCRLPINRKLEAAAELYGILLYCNAFTAELVRITTESRDLAERLPRLMKKVFSFSFDQEPEESAGKLLFVMESQEKIHKMFAQFGLSAARDVTLHVNYGMLEEDEERLAFLRGAFLSGGSVTDPAKRYHLELTTSHYKVSRETCALLLDAGFSPKETTRGGNSILQAERHDRGFSDGHRRAGVRNGRDGGEGRKGSSQRHQPPRQLRNGQSDQGGRRVD